ncbi:Universal stress protein family 1 [Photobacterium aquae]|uniref:Universal stress protein family 1 n=1 Tax=Photobacterium aquae TaxID=1195763 RepID=A0A0J1GWN9_9GAMM|nr:universal stress protein [Photobacterium aquae]KLV04133.1 Universal stress protein family 1 [Photobacterium aquae]
MSFSPILVPIAPEQALNDSFHQAFRFANQCAAQVTLLSVIEDLAELKEISRYSCTTLDLLDKATKIYHDALKEHVHVLKKQYPNICFNIKIRIGVPFIEIVKEANASHSSLVIIDSHRANKTDACKRGSNTLHLMRKSAVPIWSISTHSQPVKQVVAAIDLANQDYQEFNAKIVDLAVEFCSVTGAELTLVHAWRLESEGFLRKWSGYEDLDIALLSQQMRSERLERLKSLLIPYENSPIVKHIKLLEGETREVLPRYVATSDTDLVILGSLSRTGIAGFLMGNTAESMLNTMSCSVITLKPDSFVSPVVGE